MSNDAPEMTRNVILIFVRSSELLVNNFCDFWEGMVAAAQVTGAKGNRLSITERKIPNGYPQEPPKPASRNFRAHVDNHRRRRLPPHLKQNR